MKLIRFGQAGSEKPGLQLADGRRIDASGFGQDYDEAFFGGDGLAKLAAWAEANADSAPTVDGSVRLGPPLVRPSKIVCIGLNFSDHAAESGMEVPKDPVIFFKATSAICGPNDDLVLPRDSQKSDWEVELAFVIGKKASYVSEADAPKHLAGYMLHNDYSERSFQFDHGGQWVKGKSCDTFAPLGPFIATPDEFEPFEGRSMWLTVNGEKVQNGNTSNMVNKVPALIAHLTKFMTLLPGDVVSTGTPAGVGLGFDPPRYLKAGDVVELGIDGLGSSSQKIVAPI